MKPLLHIPFTLSTSLPPDQVIDRVQRAYGTGPWHMRTEEGWFELQRNATGLGSGQLVIAGFIVPESCTEIEGAVEWHDPDEPDRWRFAHEVFVREAERATVELSDSIGPHTERTLREVIVDPSAEGAENAAPASLEAESSRDEVQFALYGPWQPMRSARPRSTLTVCARGITVKSESHNETIVWGRIAGCEIVSAGQLQLLTLYDSSRTPVARISCARLADDEWLAAYLQAQALRNQPAAGDAETNMRERERLGGLLGSARPPDKR